MKRLMITVAILSLSAWHTSAVALDRTGSFGLGVQDSFATGGTVTTNSLGALSMKYHPGATTALQLVFAADFVDKGAPDSYFVGGRFLIDLVEFENTDFYTGIGVGIAINHNQGAGDLAAAIRGQIPLGFEWSFPSMPELGFNIETGFMVDINNVNGPPGTGTNHAIRTVGGQILGALGIGAHYYF